MHRLLSVTTTCLLLGACASSSQPPSVTEAARRAANTAQELAWLSCRHALHNLTIQASEQLALLDSTRMMLQRCLQSPAPAGSPTSAPNATPPPAANQLFQIHFDFARSEPRLSPEIVAAMAHAARKAPLVVLKGRTDGDTDNLLDARLAQARARAVRELLIAAGVDARRIRATYQPTGDHWVDNQDPTLRQLNRRVEVEVYRTLPETATPLVD